jgi:Domain of unknown function (DUF4328)
MTGQDPEGVEDTVADLDDLRLELAEASGDWTMPVVVRSYGPGEDYDEDYEDEAMVFREEHGYDVSVVRGEGSLTATYRKAVAATIVRTAMTPTGSAATINLTNRVEGRWASPGYRSARTRARWAQILVGIAAAIYVVGAITGVYELSLFDRIVGGSATDAEVASFLKFTDLLNSLSILAMVASAIAVFAWLSRVVEIIPPLGGGTPRRSPREAIGWWFVPIASFVIPYQIVRDVYRRLETPTRRGGDGAILAWWLLFIIGSLVTRAIGIAMNGATTVDAVRSIEMTGIAALAATAVGGCLLIRVIGEIESRATERAASLRLRGPDAVWPGSAPYAGSSVATATTPSMIGGSVGPAGRAGAETKVCPRCAEVVPADAIFCKYCGREFPPADQSR